MYVNGYLGTMVRDPELKQTKSGKPITNFVIASNYGFGDNKGVDYINCTAYNSTAETIVKWFSKGDSIIVQGEMHNKPWQKCTLKNGKEVDYPNYNFTVNNIVFLPGGKKKSTNESNNDNPGFYHEQSNSATSNSKSDKDSFSLIEDDDSELPF